MSLARTAGELIGYHERRAGEWLAVLQSEQTNLATGEVATVYTLIDADWNERTTSRTRPRLDGNPPAHIVSVFADFAPRGRPPR